MLICLWGGEVNKKFHIEHAPLSVSADGVLVYPVLSQYFSSLPYIPFLSHQPFHHLEMAALITTMCEVYGCSFEQLSSEHVNGYRKLIQHLSKNFKDSTNDSMASIIEVRLFEVLDIINKDIYKIRIGSVLCGNCKSRNLKVESNSISIKGLMFDDHLSCACGAIGLLKGNQLMGTPVNEFNWIKRLQFNVIINEAITSQIYAIDELALFLIKTYGYHSIFGVNPYNKSKTDRQLNQIIGGFGARCRHIKKAGYNFDKVISAFGLKVDPSSSMLKKFINESELYNNSSLGSVQKLRDMLKEEIE